MFLTIVMIMFACFAAGLLIMQSASKQSIIIDSGYFLGFAIIAIGVSAYLSRKERE